MTTIRIDTGEVTQTGSQFITKRGDLDSLVTQSKALMNNLQGQFTGQRANAIFSEWDGMQPNLQSAINTLQQAGDLLKRAAVDFGAADSAR